MPGDRDPRLRLLIVEDSARDTEILIHELRRAGYDVTWIRVETGRDLAAALAAGPWDAVISDWQLPSFDGLSALRTLRAVDKDLPFLIVSGVIGEETAVAAMKSGAQDYLAKGNLARLAPALERELHDAEVRRERRRLDEAIRVSAVQWRATFDAMQEAVALLDPELRILRSNAALKALINRTFKEIVGRPCPQLIHGTPEPPPECPAVRTRQSLRRESREVLLDGRWFDETADPVLDERGLLTGIVHVLADITERKKAEEDLRTSEAQLSNALKIARAGHWEYDVATDTFTFNDNFYRIFGATAKEIGGYRMRSADYALRFCHPDDREKVGREVQAAVETTDPAYSRQIEHRILSTDGQVGHIAVRFFVVKDEHGRTVRTYGVNQDVTEQRNATEALRESEARYRRLFESSPDAMMIVAPPSWSFAGGNPAALAIFGARDEADFISRSPWDYSPERQPDGRISAERAGEMIEIALRTGSHVFEWTHQRLDGRVFPAVVHLTRFELDGRTFLQATVRDMTEQKRAEEALLASQEQVRRALEATALALATTLEKRDPYTAGHQQRVARLATAVAGAMGLSEGQTAGLYMASILHDVGKVSVPAEMLSKPGKLTPHEYALMQTHVQAGYEILKDIEFPWPIAEIVYQHHERENGSGYPRGLTGDRLLVEAKVLAVADVVEAMASHRPYRAALGVEAALAEITGRRGVFYDEAVVAACVRLFREQGFAF
ncbi:MAG TPA: HD domain-containing phosphohydrolase [Candidatus Bathyarchaeia archaeon]|nr:HD domain-containing phosphohydrolase [Candidatus Bathyarchaeia archaeon]